jgi:hypothetical protein
MNSALASTTVGSMDADVKPTGMYSRRVVEVSAGFMFSTALSIPPKILLLYINPELKRKKSGAITDPLLVLTL